MSNIAPNDKLNLNSFLMEEKTNENELTPLMKHRKIFKEVATGKKIENKEQQNRTESKDNQKSNSKIELNKDSNEKYFVLFFFYIRQSLVEFHFRI